MRAAGARGRAAINSADYARELPALSTYRRRRGASLSDGRLEKVRGRLNIGENIRPIIAICASIFQPDAPGADTPRRGPAHSITPEALPRAGGGNNRAIRRGVLLIRINLPLVSPARPRSAAPFPLRLMTDCSDRRDTRA